MTGGDTRRSVASRLRKRRSEAITAGSENPQPEGGQGAYQKRKPASWVEEAPSPRLGRMTGLCGTGGWLSTAENGQPADSFGDCEDLPGVFPASRMRGRPRSGAYHEQPRRQ